MCDELMRLEEQAKAARREYMRQWRKQHPERVKSINARYWQRRAQKLQTSEGREGDAKADN